MRYDLILSVESQIVRVLDVLAWSGRNFPDIYTGLAALRHFENIFRHGTYQQVVQAAKGYWHIRRLVDAKCQSAWEEARPYIASGVRPPINWRRAIATMLAIASCSKSLV